MRSYVLLASAGVLLAGLSLVAEKARAMPGDLYVANFFGNNIERFTPGGVGSVFASGSGTIGLLGLAFDTAGNLYASSFYFNTIERFTPGGVGSVFANTGLNKPAYLAFDTTGNLYGSDAVSNTIERFTPGGVGSVFASTGLNGPYGLAFEPAVAGTTVPEPASMAVLGAGLLGLLAVRRRA